MHIIIVYENIAVLLIRDVLSWIPDPIPDHGFPGSRIPDLGSWMPDPDHESKNINSKGGKIENYIFLNRVQKKIGASLQRTTL